MAKLETARRRLNSETFEAVEQKFDTSKRIPPSVFVELAALRQKQILMEKQIEDLLRQKLIRPEQGLRAAATTVLLQAAILLRRIELFCAEIAAIKGAGDLDNSDVDAVLRFADGDFTAASDCYRSVVARYLRPLGSREIRRERTARRLHDLLLFRPGNAFERDTGISDIRQELGNVQAAIAELRVGIKVFGSDYVTRALEAASTDYAEVGDAELVGQVIDLVRIASKNGLDPVDQNYPVLISRLLPIRTKFSELPVWRWSVAWTTQVAVLQAWLFLFASSGAEAANDFVTAEQLMQQAFAVAGFAGTQIERLALLERGINPWLTAFSVRGRQKEIPGFRQPPNLIRLQELLDEVSVKLSSRSPPGADRR